MNRSPSDSPLSLMHLQLKATCSPELSEIRDELCEMLDNALGIIPEHRKPDATIRHWRTHAQNFRHRLVRCGWNEEDADATTQDNNRLADMLERVDELLRLRIENLRRHSSNTQTPTFSDESERIVNQSTL